MNTTNNSLSPFTETSRRTFLSQLALGAGVLAGGRSLLARPRVSEFSDPDEETPWFESNILELQQLMASGELSSRELTLSYLERIVRLNPLLRAVIETNPKALADAARLDNERRQGHTRGPLHGIPILIKDNIATLGNMETTAGSLALVGSRVPGDAPAIAGLRSAGAVILGKANLGEWANFRGFIPAPPFNLISWSARGGACNNPYFLDYTCWGSSGGSAVAAAANMCAAAVGTETDGSIVGPANVNLVVGLKPSIGLISQQGIIPISASQDTAGPITRNVTDAAILLGAMQSPSGRVAGVRVPQEYSSLLQRGALSGARIGVDRRFFDQYGTYGFPGDEETVLMAYQALQVMQDLGASLIETDTGDYSDLSGDEFTVLLFEFKAGIAQYLSTLLHTKLRTLDDLIAFNLAHCPGEMPYYGQELFEIANQTSGDLTDPTYLAARANSFHLASSRIDGALRRDNLDAIVAPHLTNTSGPAVAGYPNLSLPLGIRADGRPASILMYSGFLRESTLLALAYDLEQEIQGRRPPQFQGEIIPPVNAELCGALPKEPHVFSGKAHLPHGRIF